MNQGDVPDLELPFKVENDTEHRIVSDAEWLRGASWGDPRPGHPEGAVVYHVAEVLTNVDRYNGPGEERRRLRIVGSTHDTFKHLVDHSKPRVGENHHGMIARRFTEGFTNDLVVLEIVELHDEAFNAWSMGARDPNRWGEAEERARRLVERLGRSLPLYRRFYRCDNETGTKSQECLGWFERLCALETH